MHPATDEEHVKESKSKVLPLPPDYPDQSAGKLTLWCQIPEDRSCGVYVLRGHDCGSATQGHLDSILRQMVSVFRLIQLRDCQE